MLVDTQLGPVAPELGWFPAPRYLMRRARILRMLRDVPRGRLLEIGTGAGALACEFAMLGFEAEGLEQSAEARSVSQALAASLAIELPVHQEAGDWTERFDAVCAFDVLEHIEDDRAAVALWASWLRPGGTLLLSVPAHARLWSAGDEWAGHFRRYDRSVLLGLLREAGLEIEQVECYGFPLTNLSERIGARAYAARMREDRRANNDRSGIDRAPHRRLFPLLRSWPGKGALAVARAVQHAFVRTDLGTGYLARLRRV